VQHAYDLPLGVTAITSQLLGTASYTTPSEGGPPQATAYWFEAHLLTHSAPSTPVQLLGPLERQPALEPSSVQSTNFGAKRQEPTGAELEFFGALQAPPGLESPASLSPLPSPAAPASEASAA
jgi:hypothetical protein